METPVQIQYTLGENAKSLLAFAETRMKNINTMFNRIHLGRSLTEEDEEELLLLSKMQAL